ncbi:MAG TPA: hypothetical protein VMZ29_15630 [Candidatus Bathyarchaeia archaeon]|nr:hypothetical protein [Candidatus Bathyarchaeia archaeon]
MNSQNCLPQIYVFSISFIFPAIGLVSSLLIIFAMIFYPGGNFLNSYQEGYSLLYNGLCDIRDPTAINGEPNLATSIMLKIGIIIFAFASMIFFVVLSLFFQKRRSTKYLSIIGSLFAVLQTPFYILIFFLHSSFEFHMFLVVIAPLLQYLTVILYSIVFLIDRRFPKTAQYSLLVLAIVSILFSILVGIVSGIGGMIHYVTNRLGTNLFNFLTLIIYVLLGLILYFNFRKTNQVNTDLKHEIDSN